VKKVFLSYSRKDQAFVEELYRRLTRDGVECFFDKKSIKWGANFVLALEKGIDDCEIVVAVLSPDFCKSEWANVERTAAMVKDPAALRRRIRPLLRRPCDDLPPFLQTANHIDVTTETLFNKEYPRICRDLGGSPSEDPILPKRGQLPPPSSICRPAAACPTAPWETASSAARMPFGISTICFSTRTSPLSRASA